ncbi:MAG: hypothetical protein GWM90_09940, partial [Gemmatimonadetes bacterium]|nr:hypothetical protein [Gemmatimonadota bacterium]NIQ54236.1 hypothetical protein [Gemmatimonadota bacterium]NIU74444.1 hypothetical protein [Gammaproteobacteria bacterium]NIX20377.1 hypothetical protein [Actinomycetota bacterium]NIX44424.1 hypothetical protein [Gemmatimonadota bacterium]
RGVRSELARLSAAGYRAQARTLAQTVDSLAAISRVVDRRIRAGEVDRATEAYETIDVTRSRLAVELDSVADAIDRRSREDFERAEALSTTAATTTVAATLVAALLALL